MRLPDFLVVGAAKAGTVSLYHYLAQHPGVFMAPVNECNFFAIETADWKTEYLGPVDRYYIDQHCTKTLDEYGNLFRKATPEQVIGESSPLYLFSSAAPARIHHHIPKAKIIVILRHPVDRAFSNYQHLRRGGIEPITDFREAIQAEPARRAQGWGPWPFWYYSEMGFFARQLQGYFELFGSQRIFVRLYEDLQKSPVALLRDIYRFIGVDETFVPNVSTRHNLGGAPRIEWLHNWIVKPRAAKTLLKKFVPTVWRHRLRVGISDWNTDKGRLDPGFRAELNQMYKEDILKLQELIKRDLSRWL